MQAYMGGHSTRWLEGFFNFQRSQVRNFRGEIESAGIRKRIGSENVRCHQSITELVGID
jgi:hypothetical protein